MIFGVIALVSLTFLAYSNYQFTTEFTALFTGVLALIGGKEYMQFKSQNGGTSNG